MHDGTEEPAHGPPHDGPPPPWTQPPPRPPRTPEDTRRGINAALLIFGAAVALHLLLLAFVKLTPDGNDAWLFLPEGLFVIVAGFIAAVVVTVKLPEPSRVPFWLTGVACMFASFIIWGVTCAVAL